MVLCAVVAEGEWMTTDLLQRELGTPAVVTVPAYLVAVTLHWR